ncbi:hypothetical protein J2Z84_004054 [Agrobacterium rubi]|nr:hypothetical protein [Agrobacterium rubi]
MNKELARTSTGGGRGCENAKATTPVELPNCLYLKPHKPIHPMKGSFK